MPTISATSLGALAGSSNSEDQKAGWDGLSSIVSEKAGDNKEETESPQRTTLLLLPALNKTI